MENLTCEAKTKVLIPNGQLKTRADRIDMLSIPLVEIRALNRPRKMEVFGKILRGPRMSVAERHDLNSANTEPLFGCLDFPGYLRAPRFQQK
jgi:hypothetical protein